MAVLSRNNWLSSQRVDLADLQAIDSYTASDLRAFIRFMSGTEQSYILNGLRLKGMSGSTAIFEVKNCAIFLPNDGTGSFYIGGSDDPDIEVQIQSGETAIYVEAQFTRTTATPVTRAKWDETAVTGEYPAGQEFTTSAHAQEIMVMSITKNVVGFTPGAVPICIFNTNDNTHTNCRNMFFSVGTGGSSPNQTNQFPWSSNRKLPALTGSAYGDVTGSPFQQVDSEGVVNDSAFTCFKDFHDALLTILAEMRGVAVWYASAAQSSYVSNSNLNQLMFDSLGGMHMEPDADVYIKWDNTTGTLSSAGAARTIKWWANYGYVKWQLGGVFTSATDRSYTNAFFTKTGIVDGSNLYLSLVREVKVGNQSSVNWVSESPEGQGWDQNQTVSGSSDSFTGVAVGDWIRKESESASRYYRVVKLYGSSGLLDTDGQVADSTYTYALVDRAISLQSVEPLRYFRANYSNEDLIVESAIDKAAGTHYDANKFWIGTCHGSEFYLRDIGMLLPGGDDKGQNNRNQEKVSVQFSSNIRFVSGKLHYVNDDGEFDDTGVINLLTISRRFVAPAATNSYANYLLQSVTSSSLNFAANSTLWAKLEDETVSGTPSQVVLISSDVEIVDPVLSRYEVRAYGNSPENTYANRNVYPICKRIGDYLEFFDGTVIGPNGICSRADFDSTGAATFNAALTFKTKTVTTGYTIDYHDDYFINVTLDSGSITVNLPNISDLGADLRDGVTYRVKDIAGLASDLGYKIIVQATGGATIDDVATFEIDSPYMEVGFMKVGTDWVAV